MHYKPIFRYLLVDHLFKNLVKIFDAKSEIESYLSLEFQRANKFYPVTKEDFLKHLEFITLKQDTDLESLLKEYKNKGYNTALYTKSKPKERKYESYRDLLE